MKPSRDHILFKFFSQSVLVSFFLFHSYFILVFVLGVEPHCWVEQLDGQENKSRQSFTGPPFILINSFYITDNDRYCFEYVGRLCRTNMLSECLVPKKFLFRNKFGQRHCGRLLQALGAEHESEHCRWTLVRTLCWRERPEKLLSDWEKLGAAILGISSRNILWWKDLRANFSQKVLMTYLI